jgi:hypothetical protein
MLLFLISFKPNPIRPGGSSKDGSMKKTSRTHGATTNDTHIGTEC